MLGGRCVCVWCGVCVCVRVYVYVCVCVCVCVLREGRKMEGEVNADKLLLI